MDFISNTFSNILSTLIWAFILWFISYVRNKEEIIFATLLKTKKKTKYFLLNFGLKILLVLSMSFPLFVIIFSFIYVEVVDKEFILKIIIYTFSLFTNVCIQFYFWIKSLQKKVEISDKFIQDFSKVLIDLYEKRKTTH